MVDAALDFLITHIALSWGRVAQIAATLGPVEWVNVALATAGALVAIGAVNRMSRETELPIIAAFATVGAGLIGYTLGSFAPARWQHGMDTVLLGGLLALLVGTRRQTIWLPPRWMPIISAFVSVGTWLLFFWSIGP